MSNYVELIGTQRNKKNVCSCKNENFNKSGQVSTFRLFPIFDRKFVTKKVNTRTEIIKNLNNPAFSLNVDRQNCVSCDNLMTKQEKLQLKKKSTPFRMPFNHYRKRSTCKGGQNDYITSNGKRYNGECLENVKVIKETIDPCECPKTLITNRLVGKTGVRFINDTTYKNYLQRNGMLFSQNSEGLLNENKVENEENLYKIGNITDTMCMMYRKKPISLTDISYTTKRVSTATKKYSNPQYGRYGSVSSRSRVNRLKYQTKMSSQINHSKYNIYNNCVSGEECSKYKNPGPNIKLNKNTNVSCIPSKIHKQNKLSCPQPSLIVDVLGPTEKGDSDYYFRVTFEDSTALEKLTGDFNILFNTMFYDANKSAFYFRSTFPDSSILEKLTEDYNIVYNIEYM
tara:strand:+ start:1880 stop:3073 length:1194 start_codon:yes stop_codon:yes gene_type:complete